MPPIAQNLLDALKAAAAQLEEQGSDLVEAVKSRVAVLEPLVKTDLQQADAAAHTMIAQLIAAAEGK